MWKSVFFLGNTSFFKVDKPFFFEEKKRIEKWKDVENYFPCMRLLRLLMTER